MHSKVFLQSWTPAEPKVKTFAMNVATTKLVTLRNSELNMKTPGKRIGVTGNISFNAALKALNNAMPTSSTQTSKITTGFQKQSTKNIKIISINLFLWPYPRNL
eukprot:CAMPEP_0117750916 /NCGR_PEP_ID=MMETSP0947-20121206/10660_1 /TAXON_ID=44440 /ORGANISM="Chattonella subsalsa, Strain CCMP2191" /LENGTH=103 /DNA_ID=CAMNT_0005569189 /DNA_START=251 /DNA_END=562 /DNA_ORIENTATION=-